MSVLVTGGAGYIGSVTVEDLRQNGEQVVVIDNLVRGHRRAVDPSVPFFKCSVGDEDIVRQAIADYKVESVMHFSAFAYVGESVDHPAMYFENNVAETARLLKVLVESGIRRIVFSSTCATYGEPKYTPIDESHPQSPASPYGWSKYFVEKMLESFEAARMLNWVSLRYFNAAGATDTRGEHHDPETHLIPIALETAAGKRGPVPIYGSDYPTRDGTAVRDYIHVSDLSRAHVLALKHLQNGGDSAAFNLGNGRGYSVREVIEAARDVTGCEIETVEEPRRKGDASQLVASYDKAKEVLGWEPELSGIDQIIRSAWEWRSRNPNGYGDD